MFINLKQKGLKIFNVLLHAHTSARKIILKHFRKGQELPWILADEHYDSTYQQNRQLENEVEVRPGDQLVLGIHIFDTTQYRQTSSYME